MNAAQEARVRMLAERRRLVDETLLQVVKNMIDHNSFPQPENDPDPPCPFMKELLQWQLNRWHVDDLLRQLSSEDSQSFVLGPAVREAAKCLQLTLVALGINTAIPQMDPYRQLSREHAQLELEVGHRIDVL